MYLFLSSCAHLFFCKGERTLKNRSRIWLAKLKVRVQDWLYRTLKKEKQKNNQSQRLSIAINLWKQCKDWTFVALSRRGTSVLFLYLMCPRYNVCSFSMIPVTVFFFSLCRALSSKQCWFSVRIISIYWVTSVVGKKEFHPVEHLPGFVEGKLGWEWWRESGREKNKGLEKCSSVCSPIITSCKQ